MKKLTIFLATLVLALSACGGPPQGEVVTGPSGLHRMIDEEAGVVCWYAFQTGGLDCMPISETNLKR